MTKPLTDYGVEFYRCPTCNAEIDAPCVTAKGNEKPRSETHMARWAHLSRLYADAYNEGHDDALEGAANAWQQGEWTEITSAVKSGNPIAVAQRVTDWLRARP